MENNSYENSIQIKNNLNYIIFGDNDDWVNQDVQW